MENKLEHLKRNSLTILGDTVTDTVQPLIVVINRFLNAMNKCTPTPSRKENTKIIIK